MNEDIVKERLGEPTMDNGHVRFKDDKYVCNRIDYDKDAIIEEEIQKHPELVDALNASADRERELLMEDPIVSAFLAQAAEQMGVTPEEYLARFEEVWEDDPMTIMELLHNEFRKKAERHQEEVR